MEQEIYNHAVDITIPMAGTAGVYGTGTDVDLPTGWPKLLGVKTIIKDNSDDANFEISLQSSVEGVLQNFTHNKDWTFDAACPMGERMKPLSARGEGNRITIRTKLSKNLDDADLKYQMVFILSRPVNG